MKSKRLIVFGTAVIALLALASIAMTNHNTPQLQYPPIIEEPPCLSTIWATECTNQFPNQATLNQSIPDTGPNLVQTVRQVTEPYKDVTAAEADGYGLFLGCVSGAEGGAMGVHYPNGSLVGDGELDPMTPEVMVYEVKNGKYELVGVEYLVLVDDWNTNHESPPVLMGQLFNYVGSPNRYGMPAFYELHVWAWKNNSNGVFADWNPNVTCEDFK